MKKILLTGGTGFIGSHTTYLLLKKGYEVVIIDSNKKNSNKVLQRLKNLLKEELNENNIKLKLHIGDLRDYKFLLEVFKKENLNNNKIKGVIHFAGLKSVNESIEDPLLYWDNNVNGAINLFKVIQ